MDWFHRKLKKNDGSLDDMNDTFIYLVINGIYALCTIFFTKYYSKKAENLATKEDIGAITKEVESVKATFEQENRVLSAKLNLIQSGLEKKRDREIEALIAFYQQYIKIVEDVVDSGVFTSINTMEELKALDAKIYSECNKFFMLASAVNLLVDDDELWTLTFSLRKAILLYRRVAFECFSELHLLLMEGDNYLPTSNENKAANAHRMIDERSRKIVIFINNRGRVYRASVRIVLKFTDRFREYVANANKLENN